MGRKGDRATKEKVARNLYAEGHTLDAISSTLDISVTSLCRWKSESKRPSADLDEWDMAKQGHRDFTDQLFELFQEELEEIRSLRPSERTSGNYDRLNKAMSIYQKWVSAEKAKQVAHEVAKEVKKAGLTEDTVEDIRNQILGIGQ